MSHTIHLAAGTLTIEVHQALLPLHDLLDFASRINPKRGYLFVSKVLGKHIPCQPSRMRDIYNRLALSLLEIPGPAIFIGMAETATGLGAGVADSLVRRTQRCDIVFQHTTRHSLPVSEWMRFDEAHSHAPEHILYLPLPVFRERFSQAQTLVLVDDEISTGRTLRELSYRVIQALPHIRQIMLVSIVNWLSPAQKQVFQENVNRPVSFVSLLEGVFSFIPNLEFSPSLPGKARLFQPARHACQQTGRRGIEIGEKFQVSNGPYPKERKVSVVGTGEFQFQPFLWAEQLERKGFDVLFQSTTRSPIRVGGPIGESLSFKDEYGGGIHTYLHNPPRGREVIIAYEFAELARNHNLPEQLGGSIWGAAANTGWDG
ncbi:conserved hypothetical protein [Nitrosococcus oceani ATCC 19707]|uniref:Phosphoribosyltransferase n=2 Tax=Nitrosococcus oceani TaxID=1229 RepID=Q3JCD5_NITOC|nr:phosphoribosyltransferase domain-containing protein [Nitrosococcus oceani]ABA57511.1 conserved hypothetical protein [Nitrosococcus oceani ATCC 19707]EDZ66954.1 hypothetical protein NOC27_281 [Nitrosococcus oceani AFC27]KFI20011.1 hypothetical protein IB75_05145 [Nitrosococcus oceani C-27]GEM20699.1 hypothetical protein NONS58_21180 [Nitrosococcus oceani]